MAVQWRGRAWCPLSLRLEQIGCMLNAELVDDPVDDVVELQWFDDDRHGRGMLVFLSRREGRAVDYYQQRGLNLDRSGYHLGGGTRSWSEVDFEVARLEVADDGVDAQVRFRDVDDREIEVRVDDRDGRARRRGGLLAPIGSSIEHPNSLLLVWLPAFDLVRRTGDSPVIRIGGRDAQIGRLPGARLHRRHLIKYAAPVLAAEVNRGHEGSLSSAAADAQTSEREGDLWTSVTAPAGGHRARLVLDPGLPDLAGLGSSVERGRWHVEVDGARLTGGAWVTSGSGGTARVIFDVDQRWRPGRLPWLMRLVTTVVPVFRRWPTTYQWQCDVRLDEEPTMASFWRRTGPESADDDRRVTQAGEINRSR